MITSAISTASLTAVSQALTVTCPRDQRVTFDITGTFVATVSFEGTIDGTNWVAVAARSAAALDTATVVTTATAVGAFVIDATVFQAVRARCSAFTSGTAVVKSRKARTLFRPGV